MDEVVILRCEVRLRMLVFLLFCLAIASSYLDQISAAEDDDNLMFGVIDQAQVSNLGSTKEEELNCFLQFDRLIADKWTAELNLGADLDSKNPLSVINRFKDDEASTNQRITADTRIMLDGLTTCINNLTNKLKNPGVKRCMTDLVANEIESDRIISIPELFDYTLPLPYLTFLDIREMVTVLYQNRTLEELGPDEAAVFQTAKDYIIKDRSGRDKVFVVDQACEWKNLAALKKLEDNIEDMLKEFKQQVIRSISVKVAQAVFKAGDLKPGSWITAYRKWAPIRLQNLKDLDSSLENLIKQRFRTEHLCGYVTTLGNFFSEQELKVLLPKRVSPLHLITKELDDKSKFKESRLCNGRATRECESFRRVKKSYEDDLRCIESFGVLLSNHILYSIINKYQTTESRITYPEIVCKKNAPDKRVAIRYCRCIGSFCTFRDVGEVDADRYKLIDDVVHRI